MNDEDKVIEFKPGQTYRTRLCGVYDAKKIHIMYVLDSVYEGEKLIVYRHYGKYKQWWHQCIDTDRSLSMWIKMTQKREAKSETLSPQAI